MDRHALKLVDFSAAPRWGDDLAQPCPYGLGETGVHELVPQTYGDGPATLGFALAAGVQRAKGAIVWVRQTRLNLDRGVPNGDGLRALGVDPSRLLIVPVTRCAEALWATEEAIKSSAASLVLSELDDADFTATRRLGLCSATYGAAAILCLPHSRKGATASTARWRIAGAPSAPHRFASHMPGRIRWRACLDRARHVPAMVGRSHLMELDDETLSVRLVSGLVDRPAKTHAARIETTPDTRARTG